MRRFLHGLALVLVASGLVQVLIAELPAVAMPTPQNEAATQQPQAPSAALSASAQETLSRLADNLRIKRGERTAAVAAGNAIKAKELASEIQELRAQFINLAADFNLKEFEGAPAPKFDLQSEVIELVEPVIRTLKDMTEGTRTTSALNSRKLALQENREVATKAFQRLLRTRDALPADSAARTEADREIEIVWRPMLEALGDEYLVVNEEHKRRVAGKKPILDTVTDATKRFFDNSGLTLLLVALAFAATYFGLRFLGDLVLSSKRERAFSMRLVEVTAHMMTLLFAVAAAMVVIYARGDWFLLAISIVFLVGAGWVVVKMAPQFFEQIRLVLNIGAVREGERILVDGLPYRVDALHFYSRLSNPNLSGGVLRVPIKDLIEERSRPIGEDEPWFPCKQGEVVELADGVLGRIVRQTPEFVTLMEPHDAPRNYATTDFLAQNPRNLSHGFEIDITFGLDYSHQKQCLDPIPQLLEAALQQGLSTDPEVVEFQRARVEFATANDSSLDYQVLVEFGGEAAIEYPDLPRKINSLLVAACTEHGFEIPFPQLQVHGLQRA